MLEETIERLEKRKENLKKDVDIFNKNIDNYPFINNIYEKTKLELDSVNKILKLLFTEYYKRRMNRMGYE